MKRFKFLQFGGKLVAFNSESRSVVISQVVTEPVLLERSQNLQEALSSGQFGDLCVAKSDIIWRFVGASLQYDSRTAMRTLLGFSQEQLEVIITLFLNVSSFLLL